MSFSNAIQAGFKNWVNFRGVASRSEYWWFALFSFIVGIAASIVDTAFGLDSVFGGLIGTLVSLAMFLPRLSLLVRRFRDAGVSPLWLISALVPISGFVSWVINNFERYRVIFEQSPNPTDAEIQAMANQLAADPSFVDSLLQLAAILLLLLLYMVFDLVITLLPTKRPKQPVVASTDY